MLRLSHVVSLHGRLSLRQFWLAMLLWVGAPGLALTALDMFGPPVLRTGWINLLLAAPLMIVMATSCVRRLHDRNRSGWWLAAFLVVGYASQWWAGGDYGRNLVRMLLVAPPGLWFMVEVLFLNGVEGPNRFGPDPRAAPQASPAQEGAVTQGG